MNRIMAAVQIDEPARARGWGRALFALALALLALAVPMSDPAWRLFDLWLNNTSYGHGILIVPVMLYLFWLRRQEFLQMVPAPAVAGLAAMAGAMLAWFAGRILGIVMIEQLALVGALLSVTWAMLGLRLAVRAAPIIVYLMCAVPIWTYLTPMLQEHTALASTHIVRALGVPVYLEGLYISIPDGRFVVADVCSGMRYLLAAISLGGFYALLNLRVWWSRIMLVVLSFVLGVVFNWIRVVGIVYVGHHSQMQSSLVKDHETYGWLLFLLVVLGILVLGRLLERIDGGRERVHPPVQSDGTSARGGAAFGVAAALVGAISVAPAALTAAWLAPPAEPIRLDLIALARGSGWQPAHDVAHQWRPQFGERDGDAFASFRKHDARVPVDVFVAYYAVQRQDAEAVNDRNKNFDTEVWRRYALRPTPDRVELAPGIDGEEYLIQLNQGAARRVVWRANWVNGRFVVGTLEAKAQQLAGLLSGRRDAAALVLSTPIDGADDQARARLQDFAAANLPAILAHLRAL